MASSPDPVDDFGVEFRLRGLDRSVPGFIPVPRPSVNHIGRIAVEWTRNNNTVTFVFSNTKTVKHASVYYSRGGSDIGLEAHKEITDRTARLVRYAPRLLTNAIESEDLNLPHEGGAKFYFMTVDETYQIKASLDDLIHGRVPQFRFWKYLVDTITIIRNKIEGPASGSNTINYLSQFGDVR